MDKILVLFILFLLSLNIVQAESTNMPECACNKVKILDDEISTKKEMKKMDEQAKFFANPVVKKNQKINKSMLNYNNEKDAH